MRTMIVGVGLALIALQPASMTPSPVMLEEDTSLYASVDGQRGGILLSGTSVRVMERKQGWIKIAVEGWIRDDPSVLPVLPEAPSPEPAPRVAASSKVRLTGQIFVTGDDGSTHVGRQLTVRLLRDFDSASEQIDRIRRDCAQRQEALSQEAARLKKEAGRAMRVIENSSEAFEKYDEAKRERDEKIRQMNRGEKQCLSEVEALFNAAAVDRALSDTEGRYVFEAVAPGTYHLHTTFDAAGTRNEWIIETDLTNGGPGDIDLTNDNRTSTQPLPDYR